MKKNSKKYYDAKILNDRANLKEVYEYFTGHQLHRHSNQWEGWCPHCKDGTDRFRIPDNIPHRWFCRSCGASGSAIDIVLDTLSVSFAEACEILAEFLGLTDEAQYNFDRAGHQVIPTIPDVQTYPDVPSADWQEKVLSAVNYAHDFLMSNAGAPERNYLRSRGFTDETLRQYRIGFNPTQYLLSVMDDSGNWIKAGIGFYIPTFVRIKDTDAAESLLRVKIRLEDWYYRNLLQLWHDGKRDRKPDKYVSITGSKGKSLFCAQYARNPECPNIIFTEGEFDAMTINQVAGDICRAVTFGSHGNVSDTAEKWQAWFRIPEHTIICFDNDNDDAEKKEKVRGNEIRLQQEIIKAQSLDAPEYRGMAPVIKHLPEQYHDWNDILKLPDGAQTIRNILMDLFRS